MDQYKDCALEREELTAFDKFYIASLFFYCFLSGATTLFALFPAVRVLFFRMWIPIIGVSVVFVLRQAIKKGGVKISSKGLFVILWVFALTTLLNFYNLRSEVYITTYVLYAFFLLYKKKYLSPLVDIATVWGIIIAAFAIIGFLYAFVGNAPLMSGTCPITARTYSWYLTSATPDVALAGLTRPAGIYDEAGGLSFIICSICFLRVFTDKRDSVTFVLLLLGNITFSMIHIMVFVLFVLRLIIKYKTKKTFILYIGALFIVMYVAYLPFKEPIDQLLFTRVERMTGGKITESNNRGILFDNALGIVKNDYTVLIWGLPRNDAGEIIALKAGLRFVDNPLAPILLHGILVAWLYYFYLAFFILCCVVDRKRMLIYLSIFMVYLQRAYFHVDYYSGAMYGALLVVFFLIGCDFMKERVKASRALK